MPTTKTSVMKRVKKNHSHLWFSPLNHNIIDLILRIRDRVGAASSAPSSGTIGALGCGDAGVPSWLLGLFCWLPATSSSVPSCCPDSLIGMLRAATFSGFALSAALSLKACSRSKSSLAFSFLQVFSCSCRSCSAACNG